MDWSINFDHWKRSYRERGREERSYDLHKVVSVTSAIWTQRGAHLLQHGRKQRRVWCFIRYDPHLQTVTVQTLTSLSYKQSIGTVYIIIPIQFSPITDFEIIHVTLFICHPFSTGHCKAPNDATTYLSPILGSQYNLSRLHPNQIGHPRIQGCCTHQYHIPHYQKETIWIHLVCFVRHCRLKKVKSAEHSRFYIDIDNV